MFDFGVGSQCYFRFSPTDPFHGVNKKYVDQITAPIVDALTQTISRTGDQIPVNKVGASGSTYIWNNTDDNT